VQEQQRGPFEVATDLAVVRAELRDDTFVEVVSVSHLFIVHGAA